ncbi:hypothetical protein GCM10022280_02720 [Sphingomonas swuensis]|uniref:Porin n=2 Tax=Sphingomonas swuensis TaxID=977800 RepID=A0ABP7SAX2_9SPHN
MTMAAVLALAAPEAAEAQAAPDPAAQIAELQQQIEALRKEVEALKATSVKVTPTWGAAPKFEDKAAGWSFKPRGRLMLDAGTVSNPGDAVVTRNLGFNTRVRRLRLGVEGTIPGGFAYKVEADFANAQVGFGDVTLSYAPSGKPYEVTAGNFETLNGLEQMTSSRFISFAERSAFNDAFVNTRRLGLAGTWKADELRWSAGLFAAHSIDSSLDNDGWIAASRLTWSPKLGEDQLQFGASVQMREYQSNNGGTASTSAGAPSTNQLARLRARPFSQLTDVRFVDTGAFAARGDTILGLEALGIFGPLHLTGEAQWVRVDAYAPGSRLGGDPLDAFASLTQITPDGDPGFFGAYAEVGYYLTGESRGFRDSLWNRTKVAKPFSKGGWGALQVNSRVDWLDLDSGKLKRGFATNFSTGASTPSVALGRGGTQLGLLSSLVWSPEDWFRFYLQYSHARITGGPLAATVRPLSTKPIDERRYGVDSVQARASFDF